VQIEGGGFDEATYPVKKDRKLLAERLSEELNVVSLLGK
jgi:hypothetical protein